MEYEENIIKENLGKSAKELTNCGICPTCFDRQTSGSVFGDNAKLLLFKDKDIECLLIANPRARGHAIISTVEHFHDMTEAPDYLNNKIIQYAKQMMIFIKQIYGCERVYLCTMSDGPMNHYHIQLIPRFANEERGSTNFVKPRQKYIFEEDKFNKLKDCIIDYSKTL